VSSIYARGRRLWCKYRDASGEVVRKPTKYNVGQEELAQRYVKRKEEIATARRAAGTQGPVMVRRFAADWIKERTARGVRSARNDDTRLKTYVLPHLGQLRLEAVTPEHVRNMVRALVTGGKYAPRTIHHAFGTLHTMFEDAVIEEKVLANPVKVKRGELPAKLDADPEWRSQATYTVAEVERLISDPDIPVERRVLYALKALAGLRHGEAAALRWRHYDAAAEPLGRLTVAVSYDSTRGEEKGTKTGTTRAVPVHPTLAKVLAAWRLSHWERIYGRAAGTDDLIVPTRTMRSVNKTDSARAMKEDLRALKLRVEAGAKRSRGGHDLRAWFKTRAIEDGADSEIIRRVTHAPPKDVDSGYKRFSWAVYCREVAKLKVEIRTGDVLELGTALGTVEKKARGRWRKVVTPPGLEPGISA
jgi:integrase